MIILSIILIGLTFVSCIGIYLVRELFRGKHDVQDHIDCDTY